MAIFGGYSAGIKPGMIVPCAGNAVQDGYLLCDGSAISRTLYPELFAAIGTTYGAGDGSTTFNLPNGTLRLLGNTVPVVGNGMTLGLTQGSINFGLSLDSNGTYMSAGKNNYGEPVGSQWKNAFVTPLTAGLTKDSSKSGVQANITGIKINLLIKY